MKRLLAVILLAALAGCSDAEGARKALEDAGYTDVQTTGFAFFGCSDTDEVHTGFKAKGPTGRRVEGVVCAGIGPFGKGATIRTN